ncbi:hypothetical protein HNR25_003175 [Streptomonospora salina]|uniref:Uncharacterized protein n=1 Tax=Streptomonospora salina TaxID=104205 RepID=A0A841EAE8_9ACTN|nr:hypothetical protein [Streptomonospora salina]
MTVVTRTIADVAPTGVAIVDPWQSWAAAARVL